MTTTLYTLSDEDLFPSEYLGYVDPDDYYSYNGIITSSGEKRQYESLGELVRHVDSRRVAMNLPALPHTHLTITHYLYILGEAPKMYFTPSSSSTHPDRTFIKDIHKGATIALSLSKAAISGMFTSGSYGWVSRTEADSRASVCVLCPKNIAITKSVTTRINNKIAGLFTTSRSTSHDNKLHDCSVCGCPLLVKVHYDNSIIKSETKQKAEEFPQAITLPSGTKRKCWVRELLENE